MQENTEQLSVLISELPRTFNDRTTINKAKLRIREQIILYLGIIMPCANYGPVILSMLLNARGAIRYTSGFFSYL
jgi:hypothetical protein